jgi:predicted Rossmann-fold nucleotide-binding protein
MGTVADGVLNGGGTVIGVIPDFFKIKRNRSQWITELIVVDSMHEGKTKMNDLCDGVMLPIEAAL